MQAPIQKTMKLAIVCAVYRLQSSVKFKLIHSIKCEGEWKGKWYFYTKRNRLAHVYFHLQSVAHDADGVGHFRAIHNLSITCLQAILIYEFIAEHIYLGSELLKWEFWTCLQPSNDSLIYLEKSNDLTFHIFTSISLRASVFFLIQLRFTPEYFLRNQSQSQSHEALTLHQMHRTVWA